MKTQEQQPAQSAQNPASRPHPAAGERAQVAEGLPGWEQVSAKLARGQTLTPLEVFVYENEPAGDDADAWRDQLSAALASAPDADARDAAFEAVRLEICKLPRYSFFLNQSGGVQRVNDRSGNWVEFDAVHQLFDPVEVDAAIAAQQHKGEA